MGFKVFFWLDGVGSEVLFLSCCSFRGLLGVSVYSMFFGFCRFYVYLIVYVEGFGIKVGYLGLSFLFSYIVFGSWFREGLFLFVDFFFEVCVKFYRFLFFYFG